MATTRSAGPPPLRDALAAVNDRIADAAARSGRSRDHVALIAVTKYASPDQIRQVVELGQADLGESRVQQLAQRVPQLREFLSRKKTLSGAGSKPDEQTPDAVRWHMIGQLQRNKVKQCVPHVDLIHSVDSLRLAEELHNYGAKTDTVIDVLIQVNATGGPGGPGKGGVAAPAVVHLIEQIDTMLHLRPRGLMTMAPPPEAKAGEVTDASDAAAQAEAARPVFARAADIYEDVRSSEFGGEDFNLLSMGMSDDFEVAIEEGSNVVRVGRALFGDVES